jgi:ABC-2 type transport system ATP-binding protein
MAAIRFDNLAKTYHEHGQAKRALNGVSFDVNEGEIFGFLGPNGAGKTTAMHVLMNFLFPTAGNTEIRGIDSRDPRSRAGVGFLPEAFSFDGFLTGERFLHLFGKLSAGNRDLIATQIPELLSFFDMPDAGGTRIKSYSKGMTQKIGLAQALIDDPSILILDEPTSGMDPIAKAKIKQLFTKLRAQGKTVFLSSHILSDIEDIADRVAIINNGELLAVSRVSDLLAGDTQGTRVTYTGGGPELESAMRVRVELLHQEDRFETICRDRQTKDFVLQTIIQHGGDIVSVKPLGRSLQSRFLQLLHQEELSSD